MNRFWSGLAAAALAGLWVGAAGAASAAENEGFALGAHVGTTGIGLDAQAGLNRWLGLRASVDALALNHDATYGNIPYQGHWRGFTGGLFADVHPFGNAFMLSAGGYAGERKASIVSSPTAPITIGGHSFTPDQVGRLDGDIKLSSVEPFAGVGFNNTFRTKSHWSVIGVAGVAFSGRPQVSLASSGGTFSDLPIVQQSVASEQAIIAHDTRNYRFYPVATSGSPTASDHPNASVARMRG